jgi:fructose-bisphosphate aldolase, class I
MRSVVHRADDAGIKSVVDQQFEVAQWILGTGLIPIIEPEVDIRSPEKAEAEMLLEAALGEHLDALASDEHVLLKLTLPARDGLYDGLVGHRNVLRVLALSGGYSRNEATARLARNPGVVASFSRALTEGLSVHQSNEDFDAALEASIQRIFEASTA